MRIVEKRLDLSCTSRHKDENNSNERQQVSEVFPQVGVPDTKETLQWKLERS